MDPLTTALVAATAKLAEPAVKDAYDALKGAIRKCFGAEGSLSAAVTSLERHPESDDRVRVLSNEVAEHSANESEDLRAMADQLLKTVRELASGLHCIGVGLGFHGFVRRYAIVSIDQIGPIGWHTALPSQDNAQGMEPESMEPCGNHGNQHRPA